MVNKTNKKYIAPRIPLYVFQGLLILFGIMVKENSENDDKIYHVKMKIQRLTSGNSKLT